MEVAVQVSGMTIAVAEYAGTVTLKLFPTPLIEPSLMPALAV
jgi:hypothetical protein